MLKKRPINFKNTKLLIIISSLLIVYISYLLSDNLVSTLKITSDLPIKIFKLSFSIQSKIILIIVFTITYFGFLFLYGRLIFYFINIILDKINKKEELKDDKHYRLLLNKYSPGVLSFINDFSLTNDAVKSTIIYLESKRFISIKDDRLKIIRNNFMGLSQNERYIFNNIKNKNINRLNYSLYKEKIIIDALDYKLIEEQNNFLPKIYLILLLFMPILLTILVSPVAIVHKINIFQVSDNNLLFYLLVNIFSNIISFTHIFIIISLIYNLHIKSNSKYSLTIEGKEVLKDLKNKKKELLQKKIDDEYLIYYFILKIDNNLTNKYNKKTKYNN